MSTEVRVSVVDAPPLVQSFAETGPLLWDRTVIIPWSFLPVPNLRSPFSPVPGLYDVRDF